MFTFSDPLLETLRSVLPIKIATKPLFNMPILAEDIGRRRGLKPRYRSINRLVRSGAKQLALSRNTNVFPDCQQNHDDIDKASLRAHLEADLRAYYRDSARNPSEELVSSFGSHENARRQLARSQEEGRDLAYSDIGLPSDRFRLVRRPTLEREDAFRDASTAKGKVHIRRAAAVSEDEQVADLYRMGLLYDNEQERSGGDSFDLNSIQHDEPTYSIRPAKRARKHNHNRSVQDYGVNSPLYLDLSFSDLGDDEAIAQYIMAVTQGDDHHEAIQHSPRGSHSPQSQAPLRVIYELSSSLPSFDVDTSQPPDLVIDVLSDYDCFSDGELDDEMDDAPSQRVVQENADNPSDAWVVLGDNHDVSSSHSG